MWDDGKIKEQETWKRKLHLDLVWVPDQDMVKATNSAEAASQAAREVVSQVGRQAARGKARETVTLIINLI